MKKFSQAIFIILISLSPYSFAESSQESSSDVLEQMFTWWNGIINTNEELRAEDFERYFTADAAIVLNGNEGVRGIVNLPDYFKNIRRVTEFVEIVLPFREKFQSGNKIFTYHTIRSIRKGEKQESHNMGYAIIEDEKIAYISLARFNLD